MIKEQIFVNDDPVGWSKIKDEFGNVFDDKHLVTDDLHGMEVNLTHYPKGFYKKSHIHTMAHGMLILSGKCRLENDVYGPGTFIWMPEGYVGGHGATDDSDLTFVFIANKPFGLSYVEDGSVGEIKAEICNLFEIDDWTTIEAENGWTFLDKALVSDEETGMIVNVTKYPKGYYKPRHVHPMSHGMMILEGKMKTETGIYGPGNFIWDPAGLITSHGATDECDVLYVFIATQPFQISYPEEQ